jgi:exopolysaccharide biosynthesis polyprenyl glycosylphosphotransferase
MGSITAAQRSVRFRLHPGERRVILFMGDLMMSALAFLISIYAWGQTDWLDFTRAFLDQRIPSWFYTVPFIWIILNVELYDIRRAGRRMDTVKGVAISAAASLFLYLFVFFLSEPNSLPRRGVATFIVSASILMISWRFFYISVFTAQEFLRRVVIVGAGRAGTTLLRVIKEMWPPPFYVVGLIDDDPDKLNTQIEGYQVMGGSQDLLEILEQNQVTDLIFSISNDMNACMFQALLKAEEEGVEVTTMPLVYEDLMGRVPIFLLKSDWILRSFVDHAHANGFYEATKRLMDIVGGLVGVLILVVVYPFIALAIYLESGGPVVFKQKRMGKNGREYPIIKFRTMRQSYDAGGKMLPDKDRITKVGKILRKSHLDELPQFINVLRGEMSLVGPRAEITSLVNELQIHVPFYRARLLVKPGITGWAQVNFGYAVTVEDTGVKLEYDLYYIKHRNLLLDMLILLRTVGTVVGFRGQ